MPSPQDMHSSCNALPPHLNGGVFWRIHVTSVTVLVFLPFRGQCFCFLTFSEFSGRVFLSARYVPLVWFFLGWVGGGFRVSCPAYPPPRALSVGAGLGSRATHLWHRTRFRSCGLGLGGSVGVFRVSFFFSAYRCPPPPARDRPTRYPTLRMLLLIFTILLPEIARALACAADHDSASAAYCESGCAAYVAATAATTAATAAAAAAAAATAAATDAAAAAVVRAAAFA